MKKFFLILFLSIFCTTFAYSKDCTKIDYKNNKDDFVKCLQIEKSNQSKSNPLEIIKNMASKSEKIEKMSGNTPVDFECFNLCKQAVKATFTIAELNRFCMMQCPLK